MLIVSENLAGLVRQFEICPEALIDEFSLEVKLGAKVRRQRKADTFEPLIFGETYDENAYFAPEETVGRDCSIAPGEALLACSADVYAMPRSHFGLLQTKGSLARLFVSITCNDGQIEPGYRGRITLELVNSAKFPVVIPKGSAIGQLYIFRCGSPAAKPYSGRYQNADAPTLAQFPS